MNTSRIRVVAAIGIAAVAIAVVIFGRLSSEREAEIRACRNTYYAGHVDKDRRAMVGDVVENWQEPWGPAMKRNEPRRRSARGSIELVHYRITVARQLSRCRSRPACC